MIHPALANFLPMPENPAPALPILHNLRADPSLYVRKSVANHLNDIAKDHPERLLALLAGWDRTDPRTAWIVKRALRTLIKRGDPRALALIGATGHAAVAVENFRLTPQRLRLGGTVEFSCTLRSTARREQRLVADYAVHYVKKSGKTAPKVFKLRELALTPGASATLAGRVRLRQLSTRRHHPGRHRVVLLLNGRPAATAAFNLLAPA